MARVDKKKILGETVITVQVFIDLITYVSVPQESPTVEVWNFARPYERW